MNELSPERRVEVISGMATAVAVAVIRLRLIGPLSLSFDLCQVYDKKMMRYYVDRLLEAKHLVFSVDQFYPGFSTSLTDDEYATMAQALPIRAEKVFQELSHGVWPGILNL